MDYNKTDQIYYSFSNLPLIYRLWRHLHHNSAVSPPRSLSNFRRKVIYNQIQ